MLFLKNHLTDLFLDRSAKLGSLEWAFHLGAWYVTRDGETNV
jgi:hypothetical protein